MALVIRPLKAEDKEKWLQLFADYQAFYRADVPAEIVEVTWNRFFDESSRMHGLGAELDGDLIGITHYLFHESTWEERPTCYLEDLFVQPSARGSDAAKQLILGVEKKAHESNAASVYWHTQQYNSRARSLYDTITSPTSFIVYRMEF